MPNHQRDCFIDTAIEKPDTEDLLSGHRMNIQHSTSNIQHPTSNIEQKPEVTIQTASVVPISQHSQLRADNFPETFPIRLAVKNVMISPRAKPGNHAHAR